MAILTATSRAADESLTDQLWKDHKRLEVLRLGGEGVKNFLKS